MSRLRVYGSENPQGVVRPSHTGKALVAPTPSTAKRGLFLRDKTNKTNQPSVQEQPAKQKLKTLVQKPPFPPESLKTPSPTAPRRIASPTPGPVIREPSPVQEEFNLADLPGELSASEPPIDIPYEPSFELLDWKAVDLRGYVNSLPIAALPDEPVLDLFPPERFDWNAAVLRKDWLEDERRASSAASKGRRSSSALAVKPTLARTPATLKSRPAPKPALDRSIAHKLSLIVDTKENVPVDYSFRLEL